MKREGIQLFPDQASTVAPHVDHVFFYLIGISAFFTLLIFGLILIFSIRYRSGAQVNRDFSWKYRTFFEVTWTVIPLLIALTLFGWATHTYFRISLIPEDALEIHVIGKQWMWKLQHANGARENNKLHVPVNQPVKLIMISQDVIHDFFIPEFRVKRDVLPGYYEAMWFEATTVGTNRFVCAEYCGTEHSRMRGEIIVMPPDEYEKWLRQNAPRETPVQAGRRLYNELACRDCHENPAAANAPSLAGLYQRTVRLVDGREISATDSYIRESIVNPASRVVAGYQPLMPAYEGQLDEEDLLALLAFLKAPPPATPAPEPAL